MIAEQSFFFAGNHTDWIDYQCGGGYKLARCQKISMPRRNCMARETEICSPPPFIKLFALHVGFKELVCEGDE